MGGPRPLNNRYHLSEEDLRRLRDELVAARVLHSVGVESTRLMDRLIRITNEQRN